MAVSKITLANYQVVLDYLVLVLGILFEVK